MFKKALYILRLQNIIKIILTSNCFRFSSLANNINSLPDSDTHWKRFQIFIKSLKHSRLNGGCERVKQIVRFSQYSCKLSNYVSKGQHFYVLKKIMRICILTRSPDNMFLNTVYNIINIMN